MQPKQVVGPTIFHLELNEGMDHIIKFVYVNPSTLLPIDLTGWRADLYVKYSTGHPQVLKGLSSTFASTDGLITLGTQGEIDISILGDFTKANLWTDAVYDIVMTSPQGFREKLIRGKVNVYSTVTFPLSYNSNSSAEAMILNVGKTMLPNNMELWGYMNPLKIGVGGGLLLTGSLRPSVQDGVEIVELSYSGERLQLTFLGNIPDGMFDQLKIGSMIFPMTSSGRVFFDSGANGLGLTYWEWTGLMNPFFSAEGTAVVIEVRPTVVPETI